VDAASDDAVESASRDGTLGEGPAMLTAAFDPFLRRLADLAGRGWAEPLRCLTAERLNPTRHGDLPAWLAAVEHLPDIEPLETNLDTACIRVEGGGPLAASAMTRLRAGMDALHPWRKGPFCLHGLRIDAEWRSDRKWARLAGAIAPLDGRRVLDVGCGNGYYGYRALGGGAELVLGVDPTLRFVMQFLALNRYFRDDRLAVLPAADTDLPAVGSPGPFDTLFSMGVLYHRRDPLAHLARLRGSLRRGGQLVLETLVLPSGAGGRDAEDILYPPGRYARMRNVHAIPGVPALTAWVREAGFRRIEVVDITPTTTEEQRSTPWMRFESLDRCLDPEEPTRTVEGHPAPTRAVLVAERG
jgi:tRNA (mo5U34)-methyltransferase